MFVSRLPCGSVLGPCEPLRQRQSCLALFHHFLLQFKRWALGCLPPNASLFQHAAPHWRVFLHMVGRWHLTADFSSTVVSGATWSSVAPKETSRALGVPLSPLSDLRCLHSSFASSLIVVRTFFRSRHASCCPPVRSTDGRVFSTLPAHVPARLRLDVHVGHALCVDVSGTLSWTSLGRDQALAINSISCRLSVRKGMAVFQQSPSLF